jgi:hypothetical protein
MTRELAEREELLPSVIADEATVALQKIQEDSETAYRSLYKQAEKVLPENIRSDPRIGQAIQKIIDSTLKKLRSDLGTPAKDALYKRLERLKESWSSPEMLEGYIPIKNIIDAKQDLNQVIKYELKGGVDKLLEPLAGATRNAIQYYGRNYNHEFLNRFNRAEKLFAENARTFRKDPTLRALAKGDSPEKVFGKMNTVKGIRDLERTFGKSLEGKEAFDALKRYKLEDLLGKKLLNKKGEISWGKASGMLKEPKTRDLALELVGPENFKKLRDMTKVAEGIEEGLRKFLNTSHTATKHFDIALMVAFPARAIAQLFSGRPIAAAKTAAWTFTPRIAANLMTNPEFMEAVKSTARAGRGNSRAKFLEEAKKAAAIVASEISQNNQDE